MEESKQLKQRLRFKDCPLSWRLVGVSIDWDGGPLVLFDEGKPQQPPLEAGIEAIVAWRNTPAQAHHLVYWTGGTIAEAQFANPMGVRSTSFIQPFGDGWLLGEGRGGLGRVFERSGDKLIRTIDIGDAIEHMQTTPEGHIWVGYFDEGVFGRGIGANGLVCFDSGGNPIFKYAEFAHTRQLPPIDDCYALNIFDGQVWVCYYSDFPLVCLRDFQIVRVWSDFGSARAVAVRGQRLIRLPAYRKPYFVSRSFDDSVETVWNLKGPDGNLLSSPTSASPDDELLYQMPFSATARGSRVYIWTNEALFELP